MSLINLQTKMGIKADGSFGPTTMKTATAFFKLKPAHAAHFFGQAAHESGGFKLFSENLNYDAAGLIRTWPTLFKTVDANLYARNPEKIANYVYANRNGNGNEASGDGWKYRGRGAIQLTGKANYAAFASSINKPEILTNPDLVANEYSFDSAIFFFTKNSLWAICDQGVNDTAITALTKRINGGINGLEDRKKLTLLYNTYLTS
jgi:putative chitinase